jgi:hypothetical protein
VQPVNENIDSSMFRVSNISTQSIPVSEEFIYCDFIIDLLQDDESYNIFEDYVINNT